MSADPISATHEPLAPLAMAAVPADVFAIPPITVVPDAATTALTKIASPGETVAT